MVRRIVFKKIEGTLRDQSFRDGKYHDELIMGLLKMIERRRFMKYISTEKAPKAIGPYSQAVVAGPLIFVSGQLPIDPVSGNLVEGEIEKKTERIFENIKAILGAADRKLDSVVKVTVFVKDMGNFAKINDVYERYFGDHKPARSFVEVSNLPKNSEIEIEMIAYSEK